MKIEVTREGGLDVSPKGNPMHFPAGVYTVNDPETGMTDELAARLIRSGCGRILGTNHESKTPSENKAARPAATKRKKKRTSRKAGATRSS